MQKNELKGIIVARGLTQADVAKHLGIAEKTFNDKLKNGTFGSKEIDKLIDFLNIKNPMWIFFDRKVTFEDTKSVYYIKIV